MSYEKAVITATNTGTTSYAATFPLRTDYGLFQGFRLLTTGDAAVTCTLADADGRKFFVDVADRDYTTAKDGAIVLNQVRTGLTGYVAGDATGAALTGVQGTTQAAIKSPVTMTLTNTTAADTATLWFYYKTGLDRARISLTTPATPATVSGTVFLRNKYARIIGFNASNVTDVASIVKLTDADSRVLYLDAAGRDYRAATAINRVMVVLDDTLIGLTPQSLNSTGAAMGAAEAGAVGTAVGRSPITVEWSLNGTAGDILTCDLFYEV